MDTNFLVEQKDLVPTTQIAYVLFQKDRQVFLLKRLKSNQWVVPGGHLNPNESCKAAAIREAQEETGIELEADSLVLIGQVNFYDSDAGQRQAEVFIVNCNLEPRVMETDEFAEGQWFPIDALPPNQSRSSQAVLEELQRHWQKDDPPPFTLDVGYKSIGPFSQN